MVSRTRLQWLALGAGGALACAALCWQHREARRQAAARPGGESLQEPLRQLDRGAGMLALAVAADSTLEHCRGDFRNRAMYAPLGAPAALVLSGLLGGCATRPAAGCRGRSACRPAGPWR